MFCFLFAFFYIFREIGYYLTLQEADSRGTRSKLLMSVYQWHMVGHIFVEYMNCAPCLR